MRIGAWLGPYEITAMLGKGGMGEVYRARDPKLKRDVAIKVLPSDLMHEPERVLRFQREAELLASLNHPNIAAIYDVQASGPEHFLVLELVEGETLADRIARGPVAIEDAFPIARGICEALEAAHGKGVVHRDLKPANIKITPDDRVKVLDFGLAKIHTPDSAATVHSHSPTVLSMSAGGVILGTAAYMSPEQARGQAVDTQTDVWSFGCILYEMLTGRQAFTGETITDILGGIVRVDPDWSALPASTPPLTRLLLRQCLQKNKAARLHHIGDVRIQLEAASTDIASTASGGSAESVSKKRRPWVWMAATAAAAALGVIATAAAFRYSMPTQAAPPVLRFSIPQPDHATFMGEIRAPFPSVSHDGRMVAFLAESNGASQVWVRRLDSLDARPLAGTEGAAAYPFWSPDDRFIAFFAQRKLKKVEAAGGPPVNICDAPGALRGAWNRDDVILFDGSVLKRVSAAGGQPEIATKLEASRHETSHAAPEFLPDGDHFLFLARTGSAEPNSIMAGSLRSNDVREVLKATSFPIYDSGYLLFVRDGTLMAQKFDSASLRVMDQPFAIAESIQYNPTGGASALAASGHGTLVYRAGDAGRDRKLKWLDRSGKVLSEMGPAGDYMNPELSHDGKRVAVERTDAQTQNTDIWLIDVARGVQSRFTFDPGLDMYPVWSPDDGQITFGTSRNGTTALYQKPSSGGPETLLLKDAAIPRDWSRDNRFLVYGRAAATQVMVMPLSGDRKPFPYLAASSFEYAQARISPDGKWLVFYTNESGRNEIYVQNFPVPSAKYQISAKGGISPRWRRDGREIFYISPDNKLMAAAVRTSDNAIEVSIPSVLFDVGAPPPGNLFGRRQQYDVRPDGQGFIMNMPSVETTQTPMTVLWNWPAAFKR